MATLVREQQAHATWRDYLELTKPRVVVLMLITSLVGMFLATRAGVAWEVLIFGNLGIGLCAGAAAAVNHVVDRRIDSIMARTHKRPVTAGRLSPTAALGFALLLADELENTSNIRVNILNPGATRTSMRASAYPNEDPLTLKKPEDLMPLYVYVMSEDSLENGKTLMG